ncbi:DUF1573 domain-containing protein [Pedobacter sp. HDW13]|uniref:DUF1573 domain-containing protein n=1 Tax=Pedobacter sp. HDW13 TaxID=2714940 RepID=UPI00140D2C7E|nr:DUF1573 domain-containing protein [Pedobacter sp. HDW13]QIL37992.1 DUF1573 domain-containing protein [Pedobacter sp. HDW13]
MKKLSTVATLFLVFFLFSCKQQPKKETFLHNQSITEGFQTAVSEKKGLILISNKSGCTICESFEVDLMKDKDYAESIYQNFVLQRVDENAVGNKWLARLLNRGSFPIFLFFNKKMQLTGIEMGAINKKEMGTYIARVLKGKKWVDHFYQPGDETGMSADRLLTYVENGYNAEYYWTLYQSKQNPAKIDLMEPALKKSIKAYSTFYNNYLLAKYYALKKDSIQSNEAAKLALSVNDGTSLYFNNGLRTELKMIIDSKFDAFKEPYVGISQTEQNFGNVKFGEKKIATFKVTNLGKAKLTFNNILSDCNCTVADYPKEGIEPKKSGNITLTFSSNKPGEFSHMAEIGSNAVNAPIQLTIKGVVLGD